MRFTSVFLILMLTASAQQQPPANDAGDATFSSNTQLVIETVTVRDKSGKSIEGLTAKDFTVTEDGTVQAIKFFEYQKLPEIPEPLPPKTGDVAVRRTDGRYRIVGRIKEMYKSGGYNVYPREVEGALESHPAVAQACAFAVTDPVGGEAVAVAVRLVNDGDSTAESLRIWCRERLRREAVPEKWFIVYDIPHNARGKINRDVVRRMLTKEIHDDASERPAG